MASIQVDVSLDDRIATAEKSIQILSIGTGVQSMENPLKGQQ